jgi:sulfite reductase alpha subunit-like flavoprotein
MPLHKTTTLPSHVTVAELLGGYLDVLGTPRRASFEQLSFFATDEEEADKLREISAPGGGDLFCSYAERERRTWAEVLDDFPSCSVPLPHLLELVPPLRPREFSLASSPLVRPGVVELCVAVLVFTTPFGRRKTGICSSHLAACAPAPPDKPQAQALARAPAAAPADPTKTAAPPPWEVVVWLCPGTLPPLPPAAPAILIGPGTGVAPLRALLHERISRLPATSTATATATAEREVVASPAGFWPATTEASAPASAADPGLFPRLYFGSRKLSQDFYFASEWHNMVRMGWLGALRTAFSRDGGPDAGEDGKVYVQARLLQDADCLSASLVQPECRVVICGSANRMPSDVADVLCTILQAKRGFSEDQAKAHLQGMQRDGRYHVEAWS